MSTLSVWCNILYIFSSLPFVYILEKAVPKICLQEVSGSLSPINGQLLLKSVKKLGSCEHNLRACL